MSESRQETLNDHKAYKKHAKYSFNLNIFFHQIVVSKPKDCQSLLTTGIRRSDEYTIWINGITPTAVYCDVVANGGGWTVFQKRIDGSSNFYRGWEEYKRGFGNKSHEFWLGLDAIHALTKSGDASLRIDMTTFTGLNYHAKYLQFGVEAESTNYKLHVSGIQVPLEIT